MNAGRNFLADGDVDNADDVVGVTVEGAAAEAPTQSDCDDAADGVKEEAEEQVDDIEELVLTIEPSFVEQEEDDEQILEGV